VLQTENIEETAIHDHKPIPFVKKAKPLRHVIESRIEPQIGIS
jgi:hypothetical protein